MMNIEALQRTAVDAAELLRSLASEKRLRILCLLSDTEHSVGELCAALAVSPANASQQLAILRRMGLVSRRREGQTSYYSLASEEGRRILEALCSVYGRRPSPRDARRHRRAPTD